MKLTQLQQYLLVGALFFAGAVVCYYQFLIKPINLKIADKIATRDQKKKELEEAKKIVAKYVEFKKRADSVQRELEWIQNRIPKTIERTKLLEAISLVQNRSGVFMTSLSFSSPVAVDTYSKIPVSIRFNSDYKGLVNFLYQISVSNLFMTVSDLSVNPAVDTAHLNVTESVQMTVNGIQAK